MSRSISKHVLLILNKGLSTTFRHLKKKQVTRGTKRLGIFLQGKAYMFILRNDVYFKVELPTNNFTGLFFFSGLYWGFPNNKIVTPEQTNNNFS